MRGKPWINRLLDLWSWICQPLPPDLVADKYDRRYRDAKSTLARLADEDRAAMSSSLSLRAASALEHSVGVRHARLVAASTGGAQ